jgi:hypothetical protein
VKMNFTEKIRVIKEFHRDDQRNFSTPQPISPVRQLASELYDQGSQLMYQWSGNR